MQNHWIENPLSLGSARRDTARHSACLALSLATSLAWIAGCERAGSTDPDPPSGGQNYVLDYATFAGSIDTILTTHGCDDMACHGGGIRGTFELSPSDDNNTGFDFTQASLQVNGANPAQSALLLKPLAESAGGVPHAANEELAGFTSIDDPDYQALVAWVEAGEYR